MGTAYQMPNMASYENPHAHHHPVYAPPTSAERPRPVLNERPAPNEHMFNPAPRCPTRTYSEQQSTTVPQPRPSISSFPTGSAPNAISHSSRYQPQPPPQQSQQQQQSQPRQRPTSNSRQSTRPSTPPSGGTSGGAMAGQELSARDSAMVLHSLQIPECISPQGGNLADFVAELTYLFWFESVQVLEAAEKIRTIPPSAPVRRFKLAESSKAFKKWVQTVLSTTQVTQNVILLALLFIYRLKLINPGVKGQYGSEYRLFTVALMLGNKFLDDNTYTNKTWADVSGIPVNEIHVMEVEFLSNMRYSLLASKEEWEEWLARLAVLREYLDRSQRSASPSPLLIPSPTNRFVSPLPSPTGTLQLTPQHANTYSPSVGSSFGYSNHNSAYGNAVSPLALKPEHGLSLHRKRSFPEDDPTEPPAKRPSRVFTSGQAPFIKQEPQQYSSQMPLQQSTRPPTMAPLPPQQKVLPSYSTAPPQPVQPRPAPMPTSAASEQVRLPVPNLTLNTSHSAPAPAQPYPAMSYAPPQASPLSLPPLVPGVRAMSTVFPTSATATSYAPPHPILTSTAPSLPSHGIAVTPTTSFPPTSYGTPTKRLSPQNTLTPTAPYPGSSPLVDPFHHHPTPSASGYHTPISHSPSIYLQQRNSPYKPVRQVNALLFPPPSAFLQQYHLANSVPSTQMHYQPLGRRNELRTGIVPEYAMARAAHLGPMGGGPGSYPPPSHMLPNPNLHDGSYPQPIGRPLPSQQPYN